MYAYETGCFIMGQDQSETSCIFVKNGVFIKSIPI